MMNDRITINDIKNAYIYGYIELLSDIINISNKKLIIYSDNKKRLDILNSDIIKKGVYWLNISKVRNNNNNNIKEKYYIEIKKINNKPNSNYYIYKNNDLYLYISTLRGYTENSVIINSIKNSNINTLSKNRRVSNNTCDVYIFNDKDYTEKEYGYKNYHIYIYIKFININDKDKLIYKTTEIIKNKLNVKYEKNNNSIYYKDNNAIKLLKFFYYDRNIKNINLKYNDNNYPLFGRLYKVYLQWDYYISGISSKLNCDNKLLYCKYNKYNFVHDDDVYDCDNFNINKLNCTSNVYNIYLNQLVYVENNLYYYTTNMEFIPPIGWDILLCNNNKLIKKGYMLSCNHNVNHELINKYYLNNNILVVSIIKLNNNSQDLELPFDGINMKFIPNIDMKFIENKNYNNPSFLNEIDYNTNNNSNKNYYNTNKLYTEDIDNIGNKNYNNISTKISYDINNNDNTNNVINNTNNKNENNISTKISSDINNKHNKFDKLIQKVIYKSRQSPNTRSPNLLQDVLYTNNENNNINHHSNNKISRNEDINIISNKKGINNNKDINNNKNHIDNNNNNIDIDIDIDKIDNYINNIDKLDYNYINNNNYNPHELPVVKMSNINENLNKNVMKNNHINHIDNSNSNDNNNDINININNDNTDNDIISNIDHVDYHSCKSINTQDNKINLNNKKSYDYMKLNNEISYDNSVVKYNDDIIKTNDSVPKIHDEFRDPQTPNESYKLPKLLENNKKINKNDIKTKFKSIMNDNQVS